MCIRPIDLQQREQPPVTGAEIEDTTHRARHELQYDGLSRGAVRNPVRPREILQRKLGGVVLLDASHLSSRASEVSRGICTLQSGITAPQLHAERADYSQRTRRATLDRDGRTRAPLLSIHSPNIVDGPVERSLRPHESDPAVSA